jgi:hypothetical protein
MSVQGERYATPVRIKLSKDEAIKAGQGFFWTGIPCGRGHIAWRYTIGGSCRECSQRRQMHKNLPEIRSSSVRVKAEQLKDQIQLDRETREVYEL